MDHELRRELELRRRLAEQKKYHRLPDALRGLNEGQRAFCNMKSRQTLISAGNQQGKSHGGKIKAAAHITGEYPDWWTGPRIWNEGDFTAFVSGVTAKTTRDLLINGNGTDTVGLLGPPGDRGTGLIPRDRILEVVNARGGVHGAVDYFRVKRADDTEVTVLVFAYADGPDRLQGYTPKYGLIDEEPKPEVYDELDSRFTVSEGLLDIVFTPLKGATSTYLQYEQSPDRSIKDIFHYSLDMATHLSDEKKERIRLRYQNHPQREARLNGYPVVGEGLIFRVKDEDLVVEPFEIPDYYHRIIGIDFPHTTGEFAAASLAIDPNTDTWYLVDCYKQGECERPIYAHALHMMGGDRIPISWPHDGGRGRHSKEGSIADAYRKFGLNLLPKSASRKTALGKDSRAKTIWIEELGERMVTGRFKAFSSCVNFFKEKAVFRHEKGKIVDGNDDVLDALGKAVLGIRHASPVYSKYNNPRSAVQDLGDMFGGYDIRRGGWG